MGNPFLSTAPPTVCSLARCVGAFQPIRDACLSFSSTLHAPRWRFGHSNETRHGRSHDHGRRNRRASRVLARARRPRRVLPRVRDPPRAHPRAAPSPRPLRGGTDLVPPPGAHRRARVWRRRGIAPRRARRGRAVPGAPGSAPRVAVQGAPPAAAAPRCSDGAAWTSRVTSPGSDSWAPFSSSSSRTPSRPYPTTRERNRSRRSSAPPPARASPPPPSPSSSTTTGATSGTGCCPQPWSTRRPAGTTGRCT